MVNKFNAKKTVIDGITFDSEMEGKFYMQLLRYIRNGEIKTFTRQPKYTVLEAFSYMGEVIKGVTYTPDFLVTHLDGSLEVIEVKGKETPDFNIRLKLFKKMFPHLKISVITENPLKFGGGFISLSELKKLRKVEKKNAEKKAKQGTQGQSKGRKSKRI